jgi:LDH2 family malate/lactate/ureidoglycolate dehydrogenase
MSETIFSYPQLYQFTTSVLRQIGCPEEDADIATTVLLSAI